MTNDQKKAYWLQHIGKTIDAKNYLGDQTVGTLLEVENGVWGYGGDSVALRLDVKDRRGLNHWPAEYCMLQDTNVQHDTKVI